MEKMRKQKVKCPRCGRKVDRLLALSRQDNKTMICDDCGTEEAMLDFQKQFKASDRKV